MTQPEAIAVGWLSRHNIPFEFQTSLMGGFYELGEAVVDIILPDTMTAIRIQGTYWHQDVSKRGRDDLQKEFLQAMCYIVIDVWEDDTEDPARLEQTMRLAIQGEAILR